MSELAQKLIDLAKRYEDGNRADKEKVERELARLMGVGVGAALAEVWGDLEKYQSFAGRILGFEKVKGIAARRFETPGVEEFGELFEMMAMHQGQAVGEVATAMFAGILDRPGVWLKEQKSKKGSVARKLGSACEMAIDIAYSMAHSLSVDRASRGQRQVATLAWSKWAFPGPGKRKDVMMNLLGLEGVMEGVVAPDFWENEERRLGMAGKVMAIFLRMGVLEWEFNVNADDPEEFKSMARRSAEYLEMMGVERSDFGARRGAVDSHLMISEVKQAVNDFMQGRDSPKFLVSLPKKRDEVWDLALFELFTLAGVAMSQSLGVTDPNDRRFTFVDFPGGRLHLLAWLKKEYPGEFVMRHAREILDKLEKGELPIGDGIIDGMELRVVLEAGMPERLSGLEEGVLVGREARLRGLIGELTSDTIRTVGRRRKKIEFSKINEWYMSEMGFDRLIVRFDGERVGARLVWGDGKFGYNFWLDQDYRFVGKDGGVWEGPGGWFESWFKVWVLAHVYDILDQRLVVRQMKEVATGEKEEGKQPGYRAEGWRVNSVGHENRQTGQQAVEQAAGVYFGMGVSELNELFKLVQIGETTLDQVNSLYPKAARWMRQFIARLTIREEGPVFSETGKLEGFKNSVLGKERAYYSVSFVQETYVEGTEMVDVRCPGVDGWIVSDGMI